MKKVLNLCLFVVFVAITNLANAAGKVSVVVTNSSLLNVSLSQVSQGEKLFLKDYEGTILFNTTLNETSLYQKYFNLADVKDGIYFVETETFYDIKVTPVLKNANGVSLIQNSATTIFKPQVKVDEKILRVMYNNTEKKPVDVRLYDAEYNLLSEEEAINDNIISKNYDFSKVNAGTYKIYFITEDRVFVKEVSI